MIHPNEDGHDANSSACPEETTPSSRTRDVREDIKHHATTLFARKGYAATSIREIAHASDVTNPMIYYYFKNKRGLFEAIISESLVEMDTLTEEIMSADQPLRTIMENIFSLYFERVGKRPDLARLFFKMFFLSDGEEMSDALRTHDERGRARWEALVRRAQERGELRSDLDPQVACMCLGGLMVEPIFHYMAGLPVDLSPELARNMLRCFFEGAYAPKPKHDHDSL